MITNIRSTPKPSQNGTNFQALLPTIGDVETFKDRLKPCPLPGGGAQYSCAFITSTFIFQTYHLSHK